VILYLIDLLTFLSFSIIDTNPSLAYISKLPSNENHQINT